MENDMNKHELAKLEELLKKFRSKVDSDLAAQIEAAGWPDSTEVYRKGNENLAKIDTVIHQVSLTIFVNVRRGAKFCFKYLNEEKPDNWFTKTGDGQFVDDSGQVRDLEEEGMSRYSEQVWVAK